MTKQVTGIIEEIMNQIDSAVEMHKLYKIEEKMPEFADGYYRGKLAGLLNILWHISYENFAPSSDSCAFRYFWKQYATVSGLEKELEIFEIFKQKFSDNQKITENEIMENPTCEGEFYNESEMQSAVNWWER